MNLATEPWIPVIWNARGPGKASLLDVFQHGREIHDIAVQPHERVALMRLLICLAQAALDGPIDHAAWRTCQDRLPDAATRYLASWQQAFELFGPGPRFLQLPGLKPVNASGSTEGGAVSKLDLALATGNNSTLFDNAGGSARSFPADRLALTLLTFQNFSPGGRISKVSWGQTTTAASATMSPCLVKGMLHTYRKEGDLLATVAANLLTREQINRCGTAWGQPVWERMPSGPEHKAAEDNACRTYLGRLVPLCRAIWLGEDGASVVMGEALRYPADWREAAATMVMRERNGTQERCVLSASLDRAIWRELHAIATAVSLGSDRASGPLTLATLDQNDCDIWTGALVASQSKLLDLVEGAFHVPSGLLRDAGQELYRKGVGQAESWGARLRRAISCYHREFRDDLDKFEFRVRGNKVKAKAATIFWTSVEQRVSDLIGLVENPEPLGTDPSHPRWQDTAWGRGILVAARDAYDIACPHQTPRQMKAYAAGLKTLFHEAATSDAEDQVDTPETEE